MKLGRQGRTGTRGRESDMQQTIQETGYTSSELEDDKYDSHKMQRSTWLEKNMPGEEATSTDKI